MNKTKPASEEKPAALSEADIQSGVNLLRTLDCRNVRQWEACGHPVEDIEPLLIGNIKGEICYMVPYPKVRDEVCESNGIDEDEYLRQLLHAMRR